MTHDSWKDAVLALQARSARADTDQILLAKQLDLALPQSAPALVAAALIREHLSGPLRTEQPTPPSHAQLEYIGDLIADLGRQQPKPLKTRLQVSAWIEVLEARRAIQALKRLRPGRGDVIASTREADEVGIVVSISDDGRVNVAGPGGRGISAHLVDILARADDSGAKASDARRIARNRAASRSRPGGAPSEEKMAVLTPHRVEGFADNAEVQLLRDTIEAAEDERPIQACLGSHPRLLAGLIGLTSFGSYVRCQPALGRELIPDFLLAVADSAGVHWTLVELESPKVRVAMKDGRLAAKAREGVQQIEDWREWLINNLDYARRSPDENGLGLIEIRPESPGIVIIGRRGDDPAASRELRQGLIERRDIVLHSHDWLLEAVDMRSGRARPGGPLDWTDWRERL